MQRLSGEPAETAAPLMIEGNTRNGKCMTGFVGKWGMKNPHFPFEEEWGLA
jgi:hypothetical protein